MNRETILTLCLVAEKIDPKMRVGTEGMLFLNPTK